MDRQTDGKQMDSQTDGKMNNWTDRLVDRQTDGQMKKWTHNFFLTTFVLIKEQHDVKTYDLGPAFN
jgi:hypothetical protein